jgi:uncharacterized membrane protein YqjE
MFDAITFFIVGTSVFCIGLATGWGMRGSVKEEDHHKFHHIRDELERQRFILHDINEKVGK